MTQPPDVRAAALAATQAGTLARWQLLPLGLTDRMMEADGSLRQCATVAVRHCLHQG